MIDVTVTPPSSPTPAAPTPFDALTNQERRVLEMLIEGKQLKETAAIMCRSIKTIEKHRQAIRWKLRQSNIAGICRVYWARRIAETRNVELASAVDLLRHIIRNRDGRYPAEHTRGIEIAAEVLESVIAERATKESA